MENILIGAAVGLAAVLAYALWARKKVNDRGGCPECNMPVPGARRPTSARQALWGGWTCENCGTEMDRNGKVLSEA